MRPDRQLLDCAGVALRLGLAPSTFYKRRAALEAQGFPAPLHALRATRPACLRWDPRAIDAWLDAQLPEPLRAASPPAAEDEWALRLRARLPQLTAKVNREPARS